ncbi:MAG: DUF3520 domain-containing protein, partial [Eggerthellaceae bacterium]|nr:DUF3520 domain-containing protein [Eggerthellaceae bacterium]
QNGEWFALNVRWKEPGTDAAKEKSYVFGEAAYTQNPSDDWKFAAAVIEYCMIATDNRNMGNSTIDSVLDLLDEVLVHEEDCDCLPDEFRWEFRQLVMDSTE